MTKGLSIIVVTFNSAASIEACLSSLPASCGKLEWEAVVVDNNSHDDSISISRGFDFATVIRNDRNLGFAAACNQGAIQASGKYLMFLNPDARVLGDAVEKIVEFEDSLDGEAIIGGLVIDHDGKPTSSIRQFPSLKNMVSEAFFLHRVFPRSATFGGYYYTNIGRESSASVDSVEGSFFVVSKEVFDRLHGFNEDFFLYSEDVDLCYRAKLMGVPVIFFPGARAVHDGQEEVDRVTRRYVLAMHLAQMKFIRRYFKGWERAAMVFVKIIGLFIRVPIYLLASLVTLRLDKAVKSIYYLEAAIRAIWSSDPPLRLFK